VQQLVTQQLLYILPTCLVCCVGALLGVLTLRRSRLAGGLMIGGGVLLPVIHFARIAVYAIVLNSGHEAAVQGRWFSLMGVLTTVFGAIALSLLFVAGFADRGDRLDSTFEG
jgi:hypothetical protein